LFSYSEAVRLQRLITVAVQLDFVDVIREVDILQGVCQAGRRHVELWCGLSVAASSKR